MAFDVIMELDGVDLGPNFPIYGKSFQIIRNDDQGSAIKRVSVTLSGFIDSTSNAYVMQLFEAVKAHSAAGDTYFTYIYHDPSVVTPAPDIVIHNLQKCYIESYNEPQDTEYGKESVGEYSIALYWFEDCTENFGLAASYASQGGPAYTFDKTPKWSRRITPNRSTHRAHRYGSTAEITLEGTLFAEDHTALKAKIDSLTDSFAYDGTLIYGDFSQAVRVTGIEIQAVTLKNYANYRLSFSYDIGITIKVSRKVSITRRHSNPVITEQPYCNNRLIEYMNESPQTITYSVSVTAPNISVARTLLQTEISNTIIFAADMIEMPGGTEVWDYDDVRVDLTVIKFYPTPVVANLIGS